MNRMKKIPPATAPTRIADADGLRESFHLFAEEIRERPITTRPRHRSGGVEHHKSGPWHAVDTGEHRREGTEHGDEPPKEDDLSSVTQEHQLSEFDARRGDPQQMTVA